jgi:hypothetical protein
MMIMLLYIKLGDISSVAVRIFTNLKINFESSIKVIASQHYLHATLHENTFILLREND